MLLYLRWFTAPYRLKALHDATPEARPEAWAAFVKATDSSPLTPANEDLVDYFTRLMEVATRYREEGTPGWMTDRGKVYLGLGEPDQPDYISFERIIDGRAMRASYSGIIYRRTFTP